MVGRARGRARRIPTPCRTEFETTTRQTTVRRGPPAALNGSERVTGSRYGDERGRCALPQASRRGGRDRDRASDAVETDVHCHVAGCPRSGRLNRASAGRRSHCDDSSRSDRYSNPRSHREPSVCARWRRSRRRSRRRPGWCWRRYGRRRRRWARGRGWAWRCRRRRSRCAAERRLGGCWPRDRADLTGSPEPLGNRDWTPVHSHAWKGDPAERSDSGRGQGWDGPDDSRPRDALSRGQYAPSTSAESLSVLGASRSSTPRRSDGLRPASAPRITRAALDHLWSPPVV